MRDGKRGSEKEKAERVERKRTQMENGRRRERKCEKRIVEKEVGEIAGQRCLAMLKTRLTFPICQRLWPRRYSTHDLHAVLSSEGTNVTTNGDLANEG